MAEPHLSPAESRFLELLESGRTPSTIDVRMACSIGNVSAAARSLSDRFALAGDPRRVICEQRPHRNRYGQQGTLGYWRLIQVQDQQQAA